MMASANGGAMDPLPTNDPSQGGNDPTDAVNSGAMEPRLQIFPVEEAYQISDFWCQVEE